MHSRKQEDPKNEDYTRHKFYLRKVQTSSLYCPRYDMLSLSNNLLLHRNYDPKNDLKPHHQSPALKAIQTEILHKQTAKNQESVKQKARWFEGMMAVEHPKEGKFKCEYQAVSSPEGIVREHLNRIYSLRRKTTHLKPRPSFSDL